MAQKGASYDAVKSEYQNSLENELPTSSSLQSSMAYEDNDDLEESSSSRKGSSSGISARKEKSKTPVLDNFERSYESAEQNRFICCCRSKKLKSKSKY